MRGLLFILSCCLFPALSFSASPPTQPTHGPGGLDYLFSSMSCTSYGEGALRYWIFEPNSPRPKSAPLIMFNHGWGGTNPKVYGAWIEHLVKKGNIVVYPLYQEEGNFRYPPKQFTANAISALKDALSRLDGTEHVRAEVDKFAVVGHSIGGVISANVAALASTSQIPIPKAVACIEPGKTWAKIDRMNIELEDLARIPSDTLLLTIVGEDDRLAKDIDAKNIFNGATQIPASNKNFITVLSDAHGLPELKANHFSPTSRNNGFVAQNGYTGELRDTKAENKSKLGEVLKERIKERIGQNQCDIFPEGDINSATAQLLGADALDFFGYWKLFDGLYQAAFYGKDRQFALGNTKEQRFMGVWSDGTPVKELRVTN